MVLGLQRSPSAAAPAVAVARSVSDSNLPREWQWQPPCGATPPLVGTDGLGAVVATWLLCWTVVAAARGRLGSQGVALPSEIVQVTTQFAPDCRVPALEQDERHVSSYTIVYHHITSAADITASQ